MFPDLTPVYYLVMFGLFCAALAILGGIGLVIWLLVNHVQFV